MKYILVTVFGYIVLVGIFKSVLQWLCGMSYVICCYRPNEPSEENKMESTGTLRDVRQPIKKHFKSI